MLDLCLNLRLSVYLIGSSLFCQFSVTTNFVLDRISSIYYMFTYAAFLAVKDNELHFFCIR